MKKKKRIQNVFKRYHLLKFRSTLHSVIPHAAGQTEKLENTDTQTHTHRSSHGKVKNYQV